MCCVDRLNRHVESGHFRREPKGLLCARRRRWQGERSTSDLCPKESFASSPAQGSLAWLTYLRETKNDDHGDGGAARECWRISWGNRCRCIAGLCCVSGSRQLEIVLENTKALLSTTEITSNDGNRELNLAYVQNPELVGLIVRGMDAEELNESDAPRFAQWIRMIFEAHMTYFVQHDRGLTGDEVWDYWSRVFDRYCRRPGVIQRWQRIRGDFDSKFRDYIDAKIEEKPE